MHFISALVKVFMKGSMRGFLVSEYGGIEVLKYMTDYQSLPSSLAMF